MDLVRAGPRDGVHHSARGAPVFGRKCIGKNSKLFNGVNSERDTQNTAWRVVARVVDAYPVKKKVVRGRPRSRDTKLVPQASAYASDGAQRRNAWLQGSERSEVAPV